MAGVQTLGQEFGLRALAYSRGPKKHEAPWILARSWHDRALN
jgi:hypothetical protein